jgi:hypothetical protein
MAERRKQLGNNVHFSTTVTAEQFSLVQGLAVSRSAPLMGTRVARGSLADFTMQMIEEHFSKKYGLPFLLLTEVLHSAGVFEAIEGSEGTKPKFYPLAGEIVEAVVQDYKTRNLVGNLYGKFENSGESYE